MFRLFVMLILHVSCIGSGAVSAQEPESPVRSMQQTAVRGVVELCGRYPLVLMGERHGLIQQHSFLHALISDEGFQDRVDVLFFEVGNARYQSLVDDYISGQDVRAESLQRVWQDMCTSPFTAIEAGVYADFYRKVREVNGALPAEKRFKVVLCDPAFDWGESERMSIGDFVSYRNNALARRDRHYYEQVRNHVFDAGLRGFAVVGRSHLAPATPGGEPATVGGMLRANHPGGVFVIAPTYNMMGNIRGNPGAFTGEQVEAVRIMSERVGPVLMSPQGSGLAELDGSALLGEDRSMGPDGNTQIGGSGTALIQIADALLHLGPDSAMDLEREAYSPGYRAELDRRRRLFIEAGRLGVGGFRMMD